MATVETTCPYCGVGCGLTATVQGGQLTKVAGTASHPVNQGRTCRKPLALPDAVHSRDRALQPMLRASRAEQFAAVSWDQALQAATGKLAEVLASDGPEAVAFYISGQLLTEDYYAINKLAKGFIGTNTVDSNSRLCMSSAVAGYRETFGSDGPVPSYDDIDQSDAFFVLGSNTAACHPILWQRIVSSQKRGAKVIVVDPRNTPTAQAADLHLAVLPGTDVQLILGMLNVITKQKLLDEQYIAEFTEGWSELSDQIDQWPVERASQVCGITSELIEQAAKTFAAAASGMTLWTMGANQSSSGTDKNRALHALCLATGQIGRPGCGPLSLTGQPNAMGGREVGGLSNLLPGYRYANDAQHRSEVESYWQLPASAAGISETPGLVAEDLFAAMNDGKIKFLWVVATNPAVSFPDTQAAAAALSKVDFLVVQDAYSPTETSTFADLTLPAAQWPEKQGTMTNSERRVSLVTQAVRPPGEALPDWQIFALAAEKLGWGEYFAWSDAASVYREFVGLTEGRVCDMTGLSHGWLSHHGNVRWPVTKSDADLIEQGKARADRHSPRLYPDNVFPTPSGKARLGVLSERLAAEQPTPDFPLILTTGRVAGQWHTMSRTGKSPELKGSDPEPFVEIHPTDAAPLGIADGDQVKIVSVRGWTKLKARVSDQLIRPGVVFAPFHWGRLYSQPGSGQLNDVTQGATDPVSRQPELKAAAVRIELVGSAKSSRVSVVEGAAVTGRSRKPLQRLVIVGSGMAAVATAESVLANSQPGHWQITMIGEEASLPYNRVRLSEILRPDVDDDTELHDPDWYQKNGIDLLTGHVATELDTQTQTLTVQAAGSDESFDLGYDRLVIATGSRPAKPPILGLDLPGVMAFRTREDATWLKQKVKPGSLVTVVGGGLLGLEAAASLAAHGARVTVIHIADRIMERQLDRGSARQVERRMRSLGINLLLSRKTEKLIGTPEGSVQAVVLDGDEHVQSDFVVLATGVRPNYSLAAGAGVKTKHGIVVDDELRASAPNVWAVGECAEHRGVVYGLWAPIAQQARAAGASICGLPAGYSGTPLSTSLKVVGVDLFACGTPWVNTDDSAVEELISIDTRNDRYRKVVLASGKLAGAVLLGDSAPGRPLADFADGRLRVPADLIDPIFESDAGSSGPTDDAMVCACNQVTAGAIRAAVEGGCQTVKDVREQTGASGGCGGCAAVVEKLIVSSAVVAG